MVQRSYHSAVRAADEEKRFTNRLLYTVVAFDHSALDNLARVENDENVNILRAFLTATT